LFDGARVLVPRDFDPFPVALDAIARAAGEIGRAPEEHVRQVTVRDREPPQPSIPLDADLVDRRQLDDLVSAFPFRGLDLDFVADRAVEQRSAERRAERDPALRALRFLREHQVVDDLFALLEIFDRDAAAIGRNTFGDRSDGVHRELTDAPPDLADAHLDELLPRLGGLVFRV